jgi:hypothetical protein
MIIYEQDQLAPQQLTQCYNLVRQLRSMYISSGMGWDRSLKLEELELEQMKYLIVLADELKEGEQVGDGDSTSQTTYSSIHSQSTQSNNSIQSARTNHSHQPTTHTHSIVKLSQLPLSQSSPIYNSPIAAFASYIPHSPESINSTTTINVTYLYELHVAKNFRGTGIGRALMDAVRDDMIVSGSEALMLTVFNANGSALRFYYRYGFSTVFDDESDESASSCNCWESIQPITARTRLQCPCKKKGWRQLILTRDSATKKEINPL